MTTHTPRDAPPLCDSDDERKRTWWWEKQHIYAPMCKCLGASVTHNERGQVYVRDPATHVMIDYWSDVEDYEDSKK
jgi:hypothetical protein